MSLSSSVKTAVRWLNARKLDLSLGTAVFFLVLFVLLISRVHQLADSNYSILLSQSLIHLELINAAIGNVEELLSSDAAEGVDKSPE